MKRDPLPTSHGDMSADGLVDYLTYLNYRHNRDDGMSAEGAAKIYANAAAMEERYFERCIDEDRRYEQPEPRESGRWTRFGEEVPG